jgi:hypothetical protein
VGCWLLWGLFIFLDRASKLQGIAFDTALRHGQQANLCRYKSSRGDRGIEKEIITGDVDFLFELIK